MPIWLPLKGNEEFGLKPQTFLYVASFGLNVDLFNIGNYCQIGARVSFETVSHQLAPVENGRRPSDPSPIIVEDNVWIGSGAILLPGVTIGEGSVVAAGAVVTSDVEPFSVVGDVPAQVIRVIESD